MKTNQKTSVRKPAVTARSQGRAPHSTRRRSVVLRSDQIEALKSLPKTVGLKPSKSTVPDTGTKRSMPHVTAPILSHADTSKVDRVVIQVGFKWKSDQQHHEFFPKAKAAAGKLKIKEQKDRLDFHHSQRQVDGQQVITSQNITPGKLLTALTELNFKAQSLVCFTKHDGTFVFEVVCAKASIKGVKPPTPKQLEFVKELLGRVYFLGVVWQNPKTPMDPASISFNFSSGLWTKPQPEVEIFSDGPLFKARRITAK